MNVKNLIEFHSKKKVNIFYVFKKLKLLGNWLGNWNKYWWVDNLSKEYSFNHGSLLVPYVLSTTDFLFHPNSLKALGSIF